VSVSLRAGLVVLAVVAVVVACGDRLTMYAADQPHDDLVLRPPSWSHLMGTDHLGRDLFSRLVVGTRTTVGLAVCAATGSSILGLLVGGLCGYLGRWPDAMLMRVADGFLALPGLLLAITVFGLFGGGGGAVVGFLALTGWASLARVVRNEVTILRHAEYMTANVAAGYSTVRNVLCHALPEVFPVVVILLINALVADAFAIVSLSFLGLGVSTQTPEWGTVLFDARRFFLTSPWLFVWPSAVIGTFTLALQLVADGVRAHLDTRRSLVAIDEISMLGVRRFGERSR
jgi:nickel transport system permease protein